MTLFFQRERLLLGLLMATAVFVLFTSLVSIGSAAPPQRQTLQEALVAHLQQETNDELRLSYHRETGLVRFLGTTAEHAIVQSTLRSATPRSSRTRLHARIRLSFWYSE